MAKTTGGFWTASRGCEVFLEEGKVTMVRDEDESEQRYVSEQDSDG